MNRLILLLAMVPALSAAMPAGIQEYCEGFDDGYQAGYCHDIDFCVPPIPPVCPYPGIGEWEYQDGYDDGFERGRLDEDWAHRAARQKGYEHDF